MRFAVKFLLILPILVGTVGCSSLIDKTYFNAVEKMTGKHKREIMVSRVQEARDSQEAAATEFKSALEAFRNVVEIRDTPLVERYETMNKAFESANSRATKVTERISAVESVSDALFREWSDELKQFSNESLREKSQAKLDETRGRYTGMIERMRYAESKMEPVLAQLRDQTLYLKHNLNAAAIASLDEEVITLEGEVDQLIADMEAAIAEANQFIADLEANAPAA